MILGHHTAGRFPTIFLFKLSEHFCIPLIVTLTIPSLPWQHMGKTITPVF